MLNQRIYRRLPSSLLQRRATSGTTKLGQHAISLSAFNRFIEGPPQTFESGRMAHQAHASVIGSSGSTVVLTTIATEKLPEPPSLRTSNTFLTGEYRERHHAVGRVPRSRNRRDFRMLSVGEVLASRALDRSLRPILKEKIQGDVDYSMLEGGNEFIHRWHVLSSLQAMSRTASTGSDNNDDGDPIPLAINTAAAALGLDVAAVSLGVTFDGVVVQDAAPTRQADWLGHLLFAGTPLGKVVMMEWGANPPRGVEDGPDEQFQVGLSDHMWPELLDIATSAVRKRIEEIQNFRESLIADGHIILDEASLRDSLGLAATTVPMTTTTDSPQSGNGSPVAAFQRQQQERESMVVDCIKYCEERLEVPFLRLFGVEGDEAPFREDKSPDLSMAFPIERTQESRLLNKSTRGHREMIMQAEVESLVRERLCENSSSETETEVDETELWKDVAGDVYYKLMQKTMWKAAKLYGCRSDGRASLRQGFGSGAAGWNTVRPINATVPALPDSVHGSAHFSRGETGVLCTVTLASPKDGLPDQDPFDELRRESHGDAILSTETSSKDGFHNLPVGSLRFLRTQEALVSDLNSRNSQAEKQRTGESGSLAEVRRAFLQYDFPDYCTGQVPSGGAARQNRRALGHGNLAEKALLPVLPSSEVFPYAIRMTAETVDSNGSSSMASICGSLLALLDAGVPVVAPVAGVSVGLAHAGGSSDANGDATSHSEHGLLLDITGTEDYYGAMDFKVGGTRNAVTALQLDVKDPVECKILVSALQLAQAGRCVILDEMARQRHHDGAPSSSSVHGGLVARPQPKLSAPAVEIIKFDASRKRDLIGPGGVVLRQLEDRYAVAVDLTQEGRCLLYGEDRSLVAKAKATVMDLVADVVEGEIYQGTIVELKDFGAIVELLRNKEGILHVSELTDEMEPRDHPEGIAGFVRDNLKVGETIDVLCTGVDQIQGSIKLSRKALLRKKTKAYA